MDHPSIPTKNFKARPSNIFMDHNNIASVSMKTTTELQVTKEENQKTIPDKKEIENVSTEMPPIPVDQPISSSLYSYTKSYAQTRIQSTTFEYIWEINYFKHLFQAIDVLHSPPFPENDQFMIEVNVIPNPNSPLNIFQFYLRTDEAFTGSCTITVKHSYTSLLSRKTISGYIMDKTLIKEIKIDFTPVDTNLTQIFTVHCKFEIFHKLVNNVMHMKLLPFSMIYPQDVKSLEEPVLNELESKNEKLIKFIVGTNQYVISRKKLYATNSSYFQNICLTHDKKEIDMTAALLRNNELEAFKQLLLFIKSDLICYTSLEQQYDKSIALLKIADKYDVPTLKLRCEHDLLGLITIKNVVELIQLAFSSNAKFLESHTANFIKFYLNALICTKEFRDLPEQDLKKIMDLIEKREVNKVITNKFFPAWPPRYF